MRSCCTVLSVVVLCVLILSSTARAQQVPVAPDPPPPRTFGPNTSGDQNQGNFTPPNNQQFPNVAPPAPNSGGGQNLGGFSGNAGGVLNPNQGGPPPQNNPALSFPNPNGLPPFDPNPPRTQGVFIPGSRNSPPAGGPPANTGGLINPPGSNPRTFNQFVPRAINAPNSQPYNPYQSNDPYQGRSAAGPQLLIPNPAGLPEHADDIPPFSNLPIRIQVPDGVDGICRYQLIRADGRFHDYQIQAGSRQEFLETTSWVIRYDRGPGLGYQTYQLSGGRNYVLQKDAAGAWNLYQGR